MILTYFSSEDVAELHETEKRLGQSCRNWAWNHPASLSKFYELQIKNNLRPWFVGEPSASDAMDAKSKFLAQIYCIWAPEALKWVRGAAQWESENSIGHMSPYNERDLLHRIDRMIHQSGFRPQRLFESVREKQVSANKNRAMGTMAKIHEAISE